VPVFSSGKSGWGWPAFQKREDQFLVVLSLVIGLIVGLTVVAFILLTGELSAQMYPRGSAPWRRVLAPAAGALISGILLFKYFPDARGSGIPQTKFALFIRDGAIPLRTVFGKFLCCSISLASGIALGREGPSVHIGAGIASAIGRRFGLGPRNVRALIPVGCAAALAAAFNTPIAAVLFSLEEILGDMHAPVLGSVVLSSATSWMVLHLFLGDQPLFHVPAYKLVHPLELGIYAILGVVGGLGSVCFVKLLLKLRLLFKKLPASTVWLQPAIGGLVVGLLGCYRPEVLGVGYDYVDQVLSGDFTVKAVLILAALKIIATPMSYSSGNAGGIFGPSLFVGAMFGAATGGIAHSLLPAYTATAGAYALVGMGTAFAGIVRTPLTSVIMIFEMTRDYSIIVPLMISNLISFFISQKLQPQPIYEALALQEGVYLPAGRGRDEAEGVRVGEIMRRDVAAFTDETEPAGALRMMDREGLNSWPFGKGQSLSGIVSRSVVQDAVARGSALVACVTHAYVHADHAASYALERMRDAGLDMLPVVSRANIRTMTGIVTRAGILEAYGVPRMPALAESGGE
jgi:CIC family chloride channel protein